MRLNVTGVTSVCSLTGESHWSNKYEGRLVKQQNKSMLVQKMVKRCNY